jgi:tRNA uridine 5-carboxymethylaminomethyl modification enzyme
MRFDAVVIGAGHAGVEAVRALSSMGKKVLLVTLDASKIGAMSCNPAIGGVAKGHLVYEIDAMGGFMGAIADQSCIQARRLNMRKGPSVRSTRVQCDKAVYSERMGQKIRTLEGLTIIESEVSKIYFENQGGKSFVKGVQLKGGIDIETRAAVITAGTFMKGIMFCGEERSVGGRFGDKASATLSDSIKELGHNFKRLKTGTPARLDARTINFSILDKQWGDPEIRRFSWQPPTPRLPQLCCYITHTSEQTHEVIRSNFHKSPLFSGEIVGVGPRYCPSIEDKVKRFADRDRHQIFLEPEGLNTNSIYPNGLSTSLPADVQIDFLRTIAGLEKVELLRPGYAVEYDSIDPTELLASFMSNIADGLFLAGQVNRTSGYEEAAAQGLWAGINAALFLSDKEALSPYRNRSYMETLVDDLVSKGTEEPYRLFTSRSEYRMHLREDNAHERMFDVADSLGLLSDEQKRRYHEHLEESALLKRELESEKIRLSKDRVISLFEYLKRPDVCWEELSASYDAKYDASLEKIEIEAKYSGYLSRAETELRELQRIQDWALDSSVDVSSLPSLSSEVVEKYTARKPKSVFELCQISGITPTAVLSIVKVAGRGSGAPIVSHETR